MSWYNRTAIKSVMRATASGAAVTLLSTAFSCTLAVAIEGTAHRTLYRFFPHWYKDVRYAYGLPQLEEQWQKRQIEKAAAAAAEENALAETRIRYMGVKEDERGELIWVENDDDEKTIETDSFQDKETIFSSSSSTTTTKTKKEPRNIPTVEQLLENTEQVTQDVLGCALTG